VMEKLRDLSIEVRQPSLLTDLVGKVNEERTRRRHDQEPCQQGGTQPLARVTRCVVQTTKLHLPGQSARPVRGPRDTHGPVSAGETALGSLCSRPGKCRIIGRISRLTYRNHQMPLQRMAVNARNQRIE